MRGSETTASALRPVLGAPLKGSCYWGGIFYICFLFFIFLCININTTTSNNNNNNNNNNDNSGIAAHCCGIFSCTNPPVWPVGGVVVAATAFLVFIHHIIVFHGFSLFF